jgi:hypothetical protein
MMVWNDARIDLGSKLGMLVELSPAGEVAIVDTQ